MDLLKGAQRTKSVASSSTAAVIENQSREDRQRALDAIKNYKETTFSADSARTHLNDAEETAK